MKKVYLFLLTLLLTFGVVACVKDTTTTTTTSGTTTTTTSATTTTTTTTTTTSTTTTTTTEPDETAPIFTGIADVIIYVGDDFDPLQGISALDNIDGLITSSIVVSGEYDITVPGTYTITYTVSDTAGNTTVVTRELRVKEAILNQFYIVNGDFSDPLEAPWGHWAGEGGASTAEIVDGVLVYDVTAIGSQTWSNQFSQIDRIVENGKIYQLTFDAKADDVRPMIVQLEDRTNYTQYWTTTVDVTTSWITYTFAFEVTNATISTGKLGFFLGNIGTTSCATTVYLDNVVITELDELPGDVSAPMIYGLTPYVVEVGIPFNPLAGVTVQDDFDTTVTVNDIIITGTVDINTVGEYTLIYSISDETGNSRSIERVVTVSTTPPTSVFVVPNGDFSTDQAVSSTDGWLWKTGGDLTAQYNAQIVDGVAKIEVTNLGNVSYGVQFYLLNRLVEQGRTYRITFEAKADLARPIQVVLENGATYVRQFDHTFDLTTSWQTFTIDYYHSNPSLNNGKFGFFLGLVGTTSVPTTIYIDNIVIEAIPTSIDTEAPVITGVDDITIEIGDAFDALYGVDVTDNRDATLRVVDIDVQGLDALDTNVVGDYTLTYSITDASGNTATVTRIVTVSEGLAPSTWVVSNGDFSKDQYVPVTDDGWYWKTGTGGAFSATITGGMAQINVTNPGLVPHGVQFYQTNRVTVKDTVYIITFSAKADTPRPIKVILENGSTYARLMDVDVYLTTEWQTFTIEFNYTLDGITNAKFGFFLGAVLDTSVPTMIYLDNVNIVTAETATDHDAPFIHGTHDLFVPQNADFDALKGVSVWDFIDKTLTTANIVVTGTVDTSVVGDYTLTYTLTDASGNERVVTRVISVVATGFASTFTVVNGNMETEQLVSVDTNGWYWKTSGTGAFTASITGGVAAVNVTSLGTVPYGVQFFQQNRVIESGAIYKITFDAKADIARPIQMAIEGGASSTTRLYDQIFDLSTDWQTYSTTVCFGTSFSFNNGKFAFFMGLVGTTSVATTIYLDNVTIELIGYVQDEEAPIIVGASSTEIVAGDTFNPMTGISMFDIYDRLLSVSNIVVSGDQISLVEGVYVFDSSVAGVYTVTYTLTDKYGNVATVNRTVTVLAAAPVSTFIVPNSDFSTDQLVSGVDGEWTWKTGTGGAFTLAIQNGQVEVNVTNIGLVPHGVQFNLLNRSIVQGEIYKITFSAKADDVRPIKMVVENGSTYARLLDIDVYLTNDWVTYTVYFNYTAASISNAKFAFFMGAVLDDSVPTMIYLDNITVELVNAVSDTTAPVIYGVDNISFKLGETFDPMLGVSVWDNTDKTLLASHIKVTGSVDTSVAGDYTLVYSVRDAYGNVGTFTRVVTVVDQAFTSTFVVVNGDFSVDQSTPYAQPAVDGWGWHGTGTFTVSIADGVAAINISALGTVAWGVQFYEQNRVLQSGAIYKITFTAKADIARPIQMALEGGASSTTRLWDQTFNVSTEWVTYTTYVCLPKQFSFNNGKFAFFMGLVGTTSVATTVYLDNIIIEEIGAVNDLGSPIIIGANDVSINQNDVLDLLSGISVYDVYNIGIAASNIVITGDQVTNNAGVYSFDSSVAGVYTVTYTLTDQSGNSTVIIRTVTVN